MLLRYAFALNQEADAIESAVRHALRKGFRTGDIMQPGATLVGTAAMGDAVLGSLQELAA